LAAELVKRGYEVKLVYFPLSSRDLRINFMDGYEVIPFSRYPSPRAFIKNTLELIKLAQWADIVHFQKCHHYASIPTVVAAYLMGKQLHYDWDDWEEEIWYESSGKGMHSRFIGFSFKILERFLPLLADTLSVSSEYLRRLAQLFGVKKEVFIVPVGADLGQFGPHINGSQIREFYNIEHPLVLYIGQLHGAQYIDLFIKAANIVLHKNPQVYFMIVGEGFMGKGLEKLVEELGIQDEFIFTGSVPHHKVPGYIAAADICVAPFRDTRVTRCKSPLKIVEYLACGKAIVASNVGEVKKMIGGAGILVEPGDFHSLAKGILKLLKDDKLRVNLGNFARRRAERKYNWETSTSSLISSYQRLKSF